MSEHIVISHALGKNVIELTTEKVHFLTRRLTGSQNHTRLYLMLFEREHIECTIERALSGQVSHLLTKLGACKPSGEQNGKCFLPHARPTTRPILPTLREQIEKHLKIL
jgi:hypothetical protein